VGGPVAMLAGAGEEDRLVLARYIIICTMYLEQ
jgi:hypothetical protein